MSITDFFPNAESQEFQKNGDIENMIKNRIKYINLLKSFLHQNNCQIAQAIDQLAMLYIRKGMQSIVLF
jgi:hypothetical protein